MGDLARRQIAAADEYKAQHPGVDWDHHLVYLTRHPDGTWEATTHRPKTEFDYQLDRASCWCCMEEVCTCDPPHPH